MFGRKNLEERIRENMEEEDTEELKRIYRENDRTEWQDVTFEIIKDILEERGEEIPDQSTSEKSGERKETEEERDIETPEGGNMSLRERLEKKDNEELKKICRENDRDKWKKEAIKMAGEILEERGEELPEQEPLTRGPKEEISTSTSKALNEEDFTEGSGSFATFILGGFGVLSVIIGIMLLWNPYSGESSAGWFREISSILLINLGFIGWGFATLISILKKVMNKQNKLLVKLINESK